MFKLIALNKLTLSTESGVISFDKGNSINLCVDSKKNPYIVSEGISTNYKDGKLVESKSQFNVKFPSLKMFESFLAHVSFSDNFDMKESKGKDFQKLDVFNALVNENINADSLVSKVLKAEAKLSMKDSKLESIEVAVKRVAGSLSIKEKIAKLVDSESEDPIVESISSEINFMKVKKVRSVESLGYIIEEDEIDASDDSVQPVELSREELISSISAMLEERDMSLSDLGLEPDETLADLDEQRLNDLYDALMSAVEESADEDDKEEDDLEESDVVGVKSDIPSENKASKLMDEGEDEDSEEEDDSEENEDNK